MTNTILTNAEIEAVLTTEYITVVEEREYTPWFLDSIADLEDEMDYYDCVIDFPSRVCGLNEEELFYA
ncbi:MAG: hypothetical protein PQJ35_00700 [Sphaerochaetaceae bacterium]|nr:hypothetical protein [Sphaerochaetaceae bacterium]